MRSEVKVIGIMQFKILLKIFIAIKFDLVCKILQHTHLSYILKFFNFELTIKQKIHALQQDVDTRYHLNSHEVHAHSSGTEDIN